jgi:ubiquinol-cytochrome c reductase cytochrome c1 subunit
MKARILPLLAVLPLLFAVNVGTASAAGDQKAAPHQHWHFSGPFGTYDRDALQRGFLVYRQVCSACHSMKRVAFRNLADLGYNEAQIKAIAAEYSVVDGPDEEGEMFERPARPSDYFPSPYPNKNAAKAVNNGAYPPDLSLITKARHHGADYIYALLTGYKEAPEDKKLLDGQYYNPYMPGGVIAMAPPLSDDLVPYSDESPTTTEQYARDVSEFLTWAAEPEMERRKQLGLQVLLFLIVFSFVMYGIKKKIWEDVH